MKNRPETAYSLEGLNKEQILETIFIKHHKLLLRWCMVMLSRQLSIVDPSATIHNLTEVARDLVQNLYLAYLASPKPIDVSGGSYRTMGLIGLYLKRDVLNYIHLNFRSGNPASQRKIRESELTRQLPTLETAVDEEEAFPHDLLEGITLSEPDEFQQTEGILENEHSEVRRRFDEVVKNFPELSNTDIQMLWSYFGKGKDYTEIGYKFARGNKPRTKQAIEFRFHHKLADVFEALKQVLPRD